MQQLLQTPLSNSSRERAEQIRRMMAKGRIEDALSTLARLNPEAVMLQAQYAQAKKHQMMGLIDFGEWNLVQSKITYAALAMTDFIARSDEDTSEIVVEEKKQANSHQPKEQPLQPQVFISYNHKDQLQTRLIKGELEKEGIRVFMDISDMPAGMFIDKFIDSSIQQSNFILAVISKNSLMSGWVSKEVTAGFLANRITNKKVIPVQLDNAIFDSDFYFEAMQAIDAKIEELKGSLVKALEMNMDIRVFQDDLGRQRDLRANLSAIIGTLKNVKVTDLSNGRFDAGMQSVIRSIKE